MKFVKTKVTAREVDKRFVELDRIMFAIEECDGGGLVITDSDLLMESLVEDWFYLSLNDKRVQLRMKRRGYDQ